MYLLSDVITYVRRIIKTPSNQSITDQLIIDYINRFWTADVDARVQLYDFKTKYQFETIPLICDYNMPVYSIQTESPSPSSLSSEISYYPVYQGLIGTSYVNGIQVPNYIQRDAFWKIWPNYLQALTQVATGDGVTTTFNFTVPYFPAIPGHVDMTGVIAAANGGTIVDPIFANVNSVPTQIPYSSIFPGVYITYQSAEGGVVTIADSGIFWNGATGAQLTGLLIQYSNQTASGGFNPNPFGWQNLTSDVVNGITYNNTVNYQSGQIYVNFPSAPANGTAIQVQSYYYQTGLPRAILYYNNILTLRGPPDIPYLIEIDAYLTPAAFLNSTDSLQFGYMSEYIARGAARKILSDIGDWEQFNLYEPLFIEQERLVWKRSQRVYTSSRTGTIYSELQGPQSSLSSIGQGAT